jgi:hypothetical protein
LTSHPKEQQTLRVAKNRMLRIIFGTETEKVTGRWRILYNEDFKY